MDDQISVMSSVYWDTESRMNESMMDTSDDDFKTPHGSIYDLSKQTPIDNQSLHSTSTIDAEIKPDIIEPVHASFNYEEVPIIQNKFEKNEINNSKLECDNKSKEIINISIKNEQNVSVIPKNDHDDNINIITSNNTVVKQKSRNLRHSIIKQFSNTKTKIVKSFSLLTVDKSSKSKDDDIDNNNNKNDSKGKLLIRRMRNSFRSFPKRLQRHHSVDPRINKQESTSAVLGSDVGYFNFEDGADGIKSDSASFTATSDTRANSTDGNLITPAKPRRFFNPEKYMHNAHFVDDDIRKSSKTTQNKIEKSIFDESQCIQSILSHNRNRSCELRKSPTISIKHMENHQKLFQECIKSFVNNNTNQIDEILQIINQSVGRHLDLNSDNLNSIDSSKKFYLEGVKGSPDVWILTNNKTKRKFIALKRNSTESTPSWISITSLMESSIQSFCTNQIWTVYPVCVMSNLSQEFSKNTNSALINFLHLLNNLGPSSNSCLLFLSNFSLIIVHNNTLTTQINNSTNSKIEILQKLFNYINNFTIDIHNTQLLIKASYPLDYLTYLLFKFYIDFAKNLI